MKKYSVIKESGSLKKYDCCICEEEMMNELESHADRFPEILFTSESYEEAKEFFKTVEPSTQCKRDYVFDFELVYIEEEEENDNGIINSSIRLVNSVEFYPITVKSYQSNIELFAGEKNHTIDRTADALACYSRYSDCFDNEDEAIASAEADIRSELEEAFPNCHSEVIEDALHTVMISVGLTISTSWITEEQ